MEHLNGQGELLSRREVLEGMSKDQLVDFVLSSGEKVSEIERDMSLASEVLEGYGTSIDEELKRREPRNETKT